MHIHYIALWANIIPAAFCAYPHGRGGGSTTTTTTTTSCTKALESNPQTVTALVNDYAQLIGNYSDALATIYLADGFTDTSGSINSLAGNSPGAVTFPSKAAFMGYQETAAKIPLVVTATSAVTCDTIVIRWTQTFGAAAVPASGISILEFVCEDAVWKLNTLYTEFNSLAYLQDIGGSYSFPS